MLLLALLWVASIGAMAAGWLMGSASKWRVGIIVGLVSAVLVAGAWIFYHPSKIPEFMLIPLLARLEGSWYAPGAALLFFVTARHVKDREESRPLLAPGAGKRQVFLLKGLAFLVLGAASVPLAFQASSHGWRNDIPASMNAAGAPDLSVDANGVVRQSTPYTCAPAASATLLRIAGIDPTATEGKMVPLCQTKRWGGATTLGIAVGLRQIAEPAGWRVQIVEADMEDLKKLRKPCICAIRKTDLSHAIVVCDVDPERGVLVADPAEGLYWWASAVFKQSYENTAVAVFKEDPYEAGELEKSARP